MLPDSWLLWFAECRAWLEAIHPLAPWVVLSALACVVYVPRYAFPKYWAQLPPGHRLDTVPAAILGAAWATITTGSGDPWLAVKGAVAAIVVPLIVHYRKRIAAKLGSVSSVLALYLAHGCAHLPESQITECRALTVLEWRRKADRLCPSDSVYWDDCEHAAELDAELSQRLKECIQ